MTEPLSDAYLQQCEFDARRYQGAYVGTAGTRAASAPCPVHLSQNGDTYAAGLSPPCGGSFRSSGGR
jgi:hypothetical protein